MKPEKIKSLIKIHYLMIRRLELLLDDADIRIKPKQCEADYIIEVVNQEFNTECREATRRKRVVFARHAACYFLREYTTMKLVDIAIIMGNKDHSTVHSSVNVCKNLIETDDEYREQIEKIRLKLEEKY